MTAENKGGFDVQIAGVRAFCPGSQIDRRRGEGATVRRPAPPLPGDEDRSRRTQHRRVAPPAARGRGRAGSGATWERVEVGAVLRGHGHLDAGLRRLRRPRRRRGPDPRQRARPRRVGHPSEVLEVGQSVTVQGGERRAGQRGRPRPDRAVAARARAGSVAQRPRTVPVGRTVRGTVRRLESFGAFVEIAPGIDGLVHVSKLVLDRRIAHPRQVLGIGDEVEVTVLAVDDAAAPHQSVDGRAGEARARCRGCRDPTWRAGGPGAAQREPQSRHVSAICWPSRSARSADAG